MAREHVAEPFDMRDSGFGVVDEFMFFKAGAYSQNNSSPIPERDFDMVTFYKLEYSHDPAPEGIDADALMAAAEAQEADRKTPPSFPCCIRRCLRRPLCRRRSQRRCRSQRCKLVDDQREQGHRGGPGQAWSCFWNLRTWDTGNFQAANIGGGAILAGDLHVHHPGNNRH